MKTSKFVYFYRIIDLVNCANSLPYVVTFKKNQFRFFTYSQSPHKLQTGTVLIGVIRQNSENTY